MGRPCLPYLQAEDAVPLPFAEARDWARTIAIAYNMYTKVDWGWLGTNGYRDPKLPGSPDKHYAGKGWVGWADWLGREKAADAPKTGAERMRELRQRAAQAKAATAGTAAAAASKKGGAPPKKGAAGQAKEAHLQGKGKGGGKAKGKEGCEADAQPRPSRKAGGGAKRKTADELNGGYKTRQLQSRHKEMVAISGGKEGLAAQLAYSIKRMGQAAREEVAASLHDKLRARARQQLGELPYGEALQFLCPPYNLSREGYTATRMTLGGLPPLWQLVKEKNQCSVVLDAIPGVDDGAQVKDPLVSVFSISFFVSHQALTS